MSAPFVVLLRKSSKLTHKRRIFNNLGNMFQGFGWPMQAAITEFEDLVFRGQDHFLWNHPWEIFNPNFSRRSNWRRQRKSLFLIVRVPPKANRVSERGQVRNIPFSWWWRSGRESLWGHVRSRAARLLHKTAASIERRLRSQASADRCRHVSDGFPRLPVPNSTSSCFHVSTGWRLLRRSTHAKRAQPDLSRSPSVTKPSLRSDFRENPVMKNRKFPQKSRLKSQQSSAVT